jgi:hypothetical protein
MNVRNFIVTSVVQRWISASLFPFLMWVEPPRMIDAYLVLFCDVFFSLIFHHGHKVHLLFF